MADISLQPLDTVHPIEHTVTGSPASLAERLRSLRRRTGFAPTERTLLTAGSILMPLGVVFVLLGWYGSAHTTRVFEQIPYMVSGGLLGIALAVAGGFCYFGFFLARLLSTTREMLDALLRLEDRFDTLAVSGPSTTPRGRDGRLPVVTFVATRNGSMFHRPDCATVAAKPAAELRAVSPADGLSPCRICVPTAEQS